MISLRACLIFAVVLAVTSSQSTTTQRTQVAVPNQTSSAVGALLQTIIAGIQKYYPDAGIVGGILLSVPLVLLGVPALGGALTADLTSALFSTVAVLIGPHLPAGLGALVSLLGSGVTSLPLLLGATLRGLGLPALAGLAQVGSALALGGRFLTGEILIPGVITLGTGLGVISRSLGERLLTVLLPAGKVFEGLGGVLSNLATELLIPLLGPVLGPTGVAVLSGLGFVGKDVVGNLVGQELLVNTVGRDLLVNTVGRDVLVNTVGQTVLVDGVGKTVLGGVAGGLGSVLGGLGGLFG